MQQSCNQIGVVDMCISIVFGVNLAQAEKSNGQIQEFKNRVEELGRVYGYGIGLGREKLLPRAESEIVRVLAGPQVVFEVHDLPEPHCACDIDHDIRIASKLGEKNRFFDFVRETLEFGNIQSLSVLFFQEELPNENNIRKQMGTYEHFVELLNRWNTWQVEGFEPTRQAYYIADATPLLFTFTNKSFSQ